jgi:hypothetical protein
MGQRILFLAGLLFAMVAAFLPAAVGAGAVFFASQWIVGVPVATAFAAFVMFAVLGVEIGIGIGWLGGRFESFDLSTELRP